MRTKFEAFEKCFPPLAGLKFKAIPQDSEIGQPSGCP